MHFARAFDHSRAISKGWAAAKYAPLAMWLGGLVMIFFDGFHFRYGGDPSASGGSFGLELQGALGSAPGAMLTFSALGVTILHLLGHSWIRTGFIRMSRGILEGERSVRALFSGHDCLGAMIGWTLLKWLIFLIVFAPSWLTSIVLLRQGAAFETSLPVLMIVGLINMIPFVYVWLGLQLGDFCIALDDASAIDALKRSWRLTAGHRRTLFGFAFMLGLLQLGMLLFGLMMLCVGVIVTIPIGRALIGVAYTESYLLLTRGRAAEAP